MDRFGGELKAEPSVCGAAQTLTLVHSGGQDQVA